MATYYGRNSGYGSVGRSLGEPINPHNYNGEVIGVDYIVKSGPSRAVPVTYPAIPTVTAPVTYRNSYNRPVTYAPRVGSVTRPVYVTQPYRRSPPPFDTPLDPTRYGGEVISVDYVPRGPKYGPSFPRPVVGMSSPYNTGYAGSPYRPAYYGNDEVLGVDYIHRGQPTGSQAVTYASGAPAASASRYPLMGFRATDGTVVGAGLPRTVGPKPYLGVGFRWVNSTAEDKSKLAVVHEVAPGSPAQEAGIQPGDYLISWDGTRLRDETVWNSKVSSMSVGDVINFGIQRNKQRQQAVVHVTAAPQ